MWISMASVVPYLELIVHFLRALFRRKHEQVIVELALRQQLAVYQRTRPRPRLEPIDRAFWVAMRRWSSRWADVLLVVRPETVIRWHRAGFRLYWRRISRSAPGRPRIPTEVRDLIRRMAEENGWGARRIHAELEKLDIQLGLATVSRYLPKRPSDPRARQSWRTFLRNHRDAIGAMDFVVVPTACFQLLYVWFLIDHGSRRIVHFNVTKHPTSAWVIQQLRESFPGESSPRYVIHDRDAIFGARVDAAIKALGTEPVRTSYRCPWQNAYAERWIGTCRRELLDHVVVLGEGHLRRLLATYVNYYNADRVHTRTRDAPSGRRAEPRPSSGAKVVALPRVGGLQHRYSWAEAA